MTKMQPDKVFSSWIIDSFPASERKISVFLALGHSGSPAPYRWDVEVINQGGGKLREHHVTTALERLAFMGYGCERFVAQVILPRGWRKHGMAAPNASAFLSIDHDINWQHVFLSDMVRPDGLRRERTTRNKVFVAMTRASFEGQEGDKKWQGLVATVLPHLSAKGVRKARKELKVYGKLDDKTLILEIKPPVRKIPAVFLGEANWRFGVKV